MPNHLRRPIEGVQIIPLTARYDDRGYLIKSRARRAARSRCVVDCFGQVYLVGDMGRGAVCTFHKHAELWDWFFISQGSAKFVLVDDRAL